MRDSLLTSIKKSKEITNAIILTHNIDFVFLQTVVLAAFRKCGHPTITVFADAQCAAEAYAHQAPMLDAIGVRYRVVPVAMNPGFRFHPKAVLLSGEEEATLFVGSGNLTFGGWSENAEIWMRFDASVEGEAVFREFYQYLRQVIERVPLSGFVEVALTEAFNPATRTWLSEESQSTSSSLVGRVGGGKPLLDVLQDTVGFDPVNELVVCSPYFDNEGVALRTLVAQTAAMNATVLCQPSGSTLTQKALASAGSAVDAQQVSFEYKSVDGEIRTAFIHAKFYGLVRDDEAVVVAGSANCSRAAFLASGNRGNAELMAVRWMSATDFKDSIVGEFQHISASVELDYTAQEVNEPLGTTSFHVLAAHFDTQTLLIGFAPTRAELHRCEIDGEAVRFSVTEPGVACATCFGEPRSVRLEGLVDGIAVESAPAWIDLEQHLRATARGRSLADSIRVRMQPGAWGASAWLNIMDVFCKHLAYLPTQRVSGSAAVHVMSNKESDGTFSFEDVFSSSYRTPVLGSPASLEGMIDNENKQSLQQLLLRWFGVIDETDDTPAPNDGEQGLGDENLVDKPEKIRKRKKQPDRSDLTNADRRRIQRVIKQVEEAMTSQEFLADRRPGLLAADLKVAAVLLRTGLREEWIDAKQFFDVTHRVWIPLFLSDGQVGGTGWLERRIDNAENRSAFTSALRSPELAAALLGWAFAVVPEGDAAALAKFRLTTALAVARFPWLWDGGDQAAVTEELQVLLAQTGNYDGERTEHIQDAWTRMLRVGQALMRLEHAVKSATLNELRSRIHEADLSAGDLLWQGKAGYGVVTVATARLGGVRVPVFKLQGDVREVRFQASLTIPVRALLQDDVIPYSSTFDTEHRIVLGEFLDGLTHLFSG